MTMYPEAKPSSSSSTKPLEFQTASALRPPPPTDAPPPAPPVALVGGYIEKENGHSMPSLEEARTAGAIHQGGSYNRYSGKHKRMAVFLALAVMLIALVTGFSVAFTQNHKNRNSSSSAASNRDPDGDANESDDDGLDIPRLQAVQQYLSGAAAITPIKTLKDTNSAQYKAAQWIADVDGMQLDVPDDDSDEDFAYQFVQRYVMAVFYYSLDGPNWPDPFDFLSESPICEWNKGLPDFTVPDGEDPDFWYLGVTCDADDEILRIFMVNNGLYGLLPEELGSLVTLDHLSLYNNRIQGNFPERMKALVDLSFVNLDSNDLTGSLPAWLNSWTNLEVLGLGNNTFVGGLPSLKNMIYLEQVELDNNGLSGTVDAFKDTPALEVLFLEGNRFSQTIDATFLVDLENLRILHLANNEFGGSFPEHFYFYEVVDLRNNKLTGSMAAVPDDDEVALWFLSVYDNAMTGKLPSGLVNLPLETFDVSKNAITGSLPDDLGDNTQLVRLYLSQNNFDAGPIPDLSMCSDLQVLSMAETKRNGNIESWVGDLSELVLLDLHDNAFTGEIPATLGDLEKLEVLLLNRNRLQGSIPFELSSLINAETVFLDNNNLLNTEEEMDAFCSNIDDETNTANFMFFSVDEPVVCSTECCSLICRSGDLDCNKLATLNKYDDEDLDSRSEYVFSEDINVRSNERRRR